VTARGLFTLLTMNTEIFQIEFVSAGLLYPDVKITPRMPLAQAVHESANFASHVYTANNNCFGMKAPNERETTCTNKGLGGYATYSSLFDCCRDYYLRMRYFKILDDAALWVNIYTPSSKGGYAEDPQYSNLIVKQITALETAKKYIDPKLIIAGDAAALGIALAAAAYGVVQLVD
jgi:flagellum-specific peptidoglycan hydrolase FlgJ